jgi:hypothetical protein
MTLLWAPVRAVLKWLPSPTPRRQKVLTGEFARVDTIPYRMPVDTTNASCLMAAFPISAKAARSLLPGVELHPVSLGFDTGMLVITVVDYRRTDIGSYIEYSVAVGVTHGHRPPVPLLPLLLQRSAGLGQYVVDLPVSTEVSVKGGKGIWGMPKHRASLDFVVSEQSASALYDRDGALACLVEIERPPRTQLPLKMAADNYCSFRGLLMKSSIYFTGTVDIALGRAARGRLRLGGSLAETLAGLRIGSRPLFTAYIEKATGVLDDHFESWFLTAGTPEAAERLTTEGLESVVDLGRSEVWPPPPHRAGVPQEA